MRQISGPIFPIEQCPKTKQTHVFFQKDLNILHLYTCPDFQQLRPFRFNNYTRTAHADSTCRATWGFSSGFSSSFWICSTVTSPGEFFKTGFSFPHPFAGGKPLDDKHDMSQCLHPNVSLKVLGSDCLSVFQSFDPRPKTAKTWNFGERPWKAER